jgi:hypothetical protein
MKNQKRAINYIKSELKTNRHILACLGSAGLETVETSVRLIFDTFILAVPQKVSISQKSQVLYNTGILEYWG